MYCSQCGKPLKEGALFCTGCGARIRGRRAKRRWPWILLGAVAVIAAILCVVLFLPKSDSAPVSVDEEPGIADVFVDNAPDDAPDDAPHELQELPDIHAWVKGARGGSGRHNDAVTDKEFIRQTVKCDGIGAYFSFLELLADGRYDLEPLTAEPIMSEYVLEFQRHDYRRYTMMYRYTGKAAITRDALHPSWTPDADARCDVLVICDINRQYFETGKPGRQSSAVTYTLSAFPEARLFNAGKWNGMTPDNLPEPPVERTFRIRVGGSVPWAEHEYTTRETYLGPALEEADVLGWRTVDGIRRLYTVAGIQADFGAGEHWKFGQKERALDEVFVSNDYVYDFTLWNGIELVKDSARQPGQTAPKTTAPKATPKPTAPTKKGLSFTVVVDANGSKKNLTVTTEETMLGPALRALGLIEGTKESWGFFIRKVAGVAANEAAGEFWAVYKDGKTLQTGIDSTPIAAGDTYTFILTK